MTDFNKQAGYYAQFRPGYPAALAASLAALVDYRGVAWDCGTGTGQMAVLLANHFNLVCATDIGEASLRKAPPHKGILYSQQPAEKTDFPNEYFDLIIAAQAAHWFDLDAFYAEVKRVARPNALIAIIGYGRPQLPPAIMPWYDSVEYDLLEGYWSSKVDALDNHYKDLYFPFDEIQIAWEDITEWWSAEQLAGFIRSWSATQNLIADGKEFLLKEAMAALPALWPMQEDKVEVSFPVFGHLGYVSKA